MTNINNQLFQIAKNKPLTNFCTHKLWLYLCFGVFLTKIVVTLIHPLDAHSLSVE
jgi:hypothetical protein